MRVHHIGYLVSDISLALKEFILLGFSQIGEIDKDTSRGCYGIFLTNSDYVVELIQPIDEKSPFFGLKKRFKNSPYHLCFETNDMQTTLNELCTREGGCMLFLPPQAAPVIAVGAQVAFLISPHIGIIEIVDKEA